MGISSPEVKKLDLEIASNIYFADNCAVQVDYELFETSTSTWSSVSVGSPNYIKDLGSNYLNYFIEIDIDDSDVNSAQYRPTSSFDLRITVYMPDSIKSSDKSTVQDIFTVTLEDECLSNELSFTGG